MVATLAVGCGAALSSFLGYDDYSRALEKAYDKYETQYGIVFDISQQEYEAMTEAQKETYDAAYDALIADEEAMKAYNMMVNLTLVITTCGILLAVLLWELLIPLFLGNGQTLGKKIFGLCLFALFISVAALTVTPLLNVAVSSKVITNNIERNRLVLFIKFLRIF